MRRISTFLFLAVLLSGPAAAQVVSPLDPNETYLPIIQFTSPQSGTCVSSQFCLKPDQGIPIGTFATKTELNTLSTQITSVNDSLNARIDAVLGSLADLGSRLPTIDARLSALDSQMAGVNAQLGAINTHLGSIDSRLSKALELVAVSAALKDAIPNADDRFAFSVNAAGFSGEFAGALGLGANLGEHARISVNYGRGKSESTVSGGLNFSFR